jgi:hypothetical protein
MVAMLHASEQADPSAAAQQAVAGFREVAARWWLARALNLLGTPAAMAEANELERKLRIRP